LLFKKIEEVTNESEVETAAMSWKRRTVNWVDCIDRKPAQSALVEENANTCDQAFLVIGSSE